MFLKVRRKMQLAERRVIMDNVANSIKQYLKGMRPGEVWSFKLWCGGNGNIRILQKWLKNEFGYETKFATEHIQFTDVTKLEVTQYYPKYNEASMIQIGCKTAEAYELYFTPFEGVKKAGAKMKA